MVPGIDVSHFQGTIAWSELAASEIRFGFIKATEGAGYVDPKFAANWLGARTAGVTRGAYHFFRPAIPAQTQAESFLRTVGTLQPGDLPPVLDLEAPAAWSQLAVADRVARVIAWLETVEKRSGATPIVYLSPSFAGEVLKNAPSLARFPLWLAHHTDNGAPELVEPWTSWTFWQHSPNGRAAGVTGSVDLDQFNGTLEGLKALTVKA